MRKTPKKLRRTPAQARSRATVGAILEAAARILRRDGAAGLKTEAIAAHAGVSVGSLYDYFPTKDAIVIALARALLAADVRAIEAALAANPADPIRATVRTLIHLHRTDRDYRRSIMSAHIGAGHAGEHAETVDAAMALIRRHAPDDRPLDSLAAFVASRSVLGVCRALVDERAGFEVDPAELERALTALVVRVLERSD